MTDKAQRLLDEVFIPSAMPFLKEYIVFCTQRGMAEQLGLSPSAINSAIRELTEEGIISKYAGGVYLLHMALIWQGGAFS